MKTNINKSSKVFGLSLALCLFAAVPALAQPTVVGCSFSVNTWASVVNMTVSFGGPVYVDSVTATEPTNYVLQDVGVGGATVSNGVLDSTGTNVTFDVTGVFGGDNYTLNVSGVQDQIGNTMVATNLSGTLPAIRFAILDGVGTASSSSNPFGLPPSNARDDDITTIAHTSNGDNEWWELDLGTNAGPIGAIAIWFRTDCCYERDRHLLFSILDNTRATLWTGYIDQALPATNPRTTNMVVGAAVMGRFVRIEHPTGAASQDFLDFTEVQLLGPSSGLVIGADPVSQTVPLAKPATFTVGVQGTDPITYQWQHEGTNIPGGTNATLLIASATPADAGSYLVAVTDGAGRQRTSAAATLSIFVDTVPPTVTGHSWDVNTFKNQVTLTVNFSEPLDPATATNAANYVFVGAGGTVGSGVTDGSNVTFIVSGPLADSYSLRVTGVTDLAGNPMVTTNLTGSVPATPYGYLGGIATQSTTPAGVPASGARDGNLLTIENTGNGDNEWWEVDLGSPVNIGAIVMWFRTDGLTERNHDLLFSIMDADRNTLWTNYIGPASSILVTNFVVDPPVMGQIVRVEHPVGISEFLNFAEVEVLSPPTYAIGTQKLGLTRSGSGLNFVWPISGWILQTNANLADPAGWGDVPGAAASPFIASAGPGSKLFYRLRKLAGWEIGAAVAFEAESTTNLLAGTPENWIVTPDALASGGSALRADGVTSSGDSPHSFAQYQINFTKPGTYYIYYRWRADNPTSSTDANSFWIGNGFGAFSTPGDQTGFVLSASNNYTAPADSTYQWLQDVAALQFVVGAAEIASPPTLTFGTREAGMTIDRVVLSTNPSLTAQDLDSMPNTQ